jgi:hypothetical protein
VSADLELELGVLSREHALDEMVARTQAFLRRGEPRVDVVAELVGQIHESVWTRDDLATLLAVAVTVLAEKKGESR